MLFLPSEQFNFKLLRQTLLFFLLILDANVFVIQESQLLLEVFEFLVEFAQLLFVCSSEEILLCEVHSHLFLKLFSFLLALAKSNLQCVPVFDKRFDVKLQQVDFAF
jgi:hypothetical protein